MFGWKFKLKLILLCAGVILGLVAFVAFNSFGIDPETIYNAQDEMNVAIYDRARGYRYSGNEIYGIFNKGQEVENTEIIDDGIVPPESDNGGGVYDPNSNVINTPTGMPAPLYKQGDSRWASILYYPNNTVGTAGCYPTSLAMIISHMIEQQVTPDTIVMWIQNNVQGYYVQGSGSSYSVIRPVVENWGLRVGNGPIPLTKANIQECLDNGGTIIFRTGSGWFTNGGHGMAILGYAGDRDHVFINNPSNGVKGNPAGSGQAYNDAYAFLIDDLCKSPATTKPQMWTIYK